MTAEDLVQTIVDFIAEGSWYVLGALVFVLFIALLDGMRSKGGSTEDSGGKRRPFSGDGGDGDGGDGNGDM